MSEITYGCAFCGHAVDAPIAVHVDWNWSGKDKSDVQMWPAHRGCFIKSLCEQARVFSWEDDE